MRTGGIGLIRTLAGVLLVVVLVIVLVYTEKQISDYPTASAVQVIQIYAEALFYGVTAIGIAIACYIFSGGLEE